MSLRAVKPWPRSLAARTAVTMLIGLACVQGAGLTIHALDRIDLQRQSQARDIAVRVMSLYRAVVSVPPPQRIAALHDAERPPGLQGRLDAAPTSSDMGPLRADMARQIRDDFALVPVPALARPKSVELLGGAPWDRLLARMRLPDGLWLSIETEMPPPRPWHSTTFLIAFLLMTAAAAALTVWAVRRLVRPLETLAVAAEALGRDVNARPLPERGPTEIATAAAAFNTMAGRISRFVHDRTLMLAAIGHDLRTPITRLKLRAEFLDDDDLRAKMLGDLDELERMIAATLAFGRDSARGEAVVPLDLAELLRTVLDDAGDTVPDAADKLGYDGPAHLTVGARPIALKRALANLVGNAVKYGGAARVRLRTARAGLVAVDIEDDGPGVPDAECERLFQPFQRLETSRNKETGGVGLGLPIARDIIRAHGGDVRLANRAEGGLRAQVTLPV